MIDVKPATATETLPNVSRRSPRRLGWTVGIGLAAAVAAGAVWHFRPGAVAPAPAAAAPAAAIPVSVATVEQRDTAIWKGRKAHLCGNVR